MSRKSGQGMNYNVQKVRARNELQCREEQGKKQTTMLGGAAELNQQSCEVGKSRGVKLTTF